MAKSRVTKAQITLYEQERDKFKADLETLAKKYVSGKRTLAAFEKAMREGLKRFYIRVALIAKGKHKFSDKDRGDLQKFLGLIYSYLDDFIDDLDLYSRKELATDQGVISRASSYGVGWGVFSRFTIPGELADMLPFLPGISCMGDGDCGCILEYDNDEEGYNVYWVRNPFKESCVVCLDLSVEWSPYKISYQELEEEFGEDIFDEGGGFIEF